MNIMKVQYKDKEIEVEEGKKIQEILQGEKENKRYGSV